MKKIHRKKVQAYTLMELLIVLTIIGILMSIGFAAYSKIQQSAMKKAANVEIKQFRVAILNFRMDQNRDPADVKELLNSGFINRELALDPWGQEYRLEFDSNGGFRVISAGPDKKFGTEDDIVDTEAQ